jgi:hypothetical protein
MRHVSTCCDSLNSRIKGTQRWYQAFDEEARGIFMHRIRLASVFWDTFASAPHDHVIFKMIDQQIKDSRIPACRSSDIAQNLKTKTAGKGVSATASRAT